MSSVAALGDGVDGTDVVVNPLPIISKNGRRQSLHLKRERKKINIYIKGKRISHQ
jgi:hypothetical protein